MAAVAVPIIGAVVSGVAGSMINGRRQREDPSVAAAQRRQEALQAQQTAAQNRMQLETDKQEESLSARRAAQRRSAARGREALAFSGNQSNLQDTLGG